MDGMSRLSYFDMSVHLWKQRNKKRVGERLQKSDQSQNTLFFKLLYKNWQKNL